MFGFWVSGSCFRTKGLARTTKAGIKLDGPKISYRSALIGGFTQLRFEPCILRVQCAVFRLVGFAGA